ncbi:unnamed protein product, partial [Discosporangium mesarthrocarpum]
WEDARVRVRVNINIILPFLSRHILSVFATQAASNMSSTWCREGGGGRLLLAYSLIFSSLPVKPASIVANHHVMGIRRYVQANHRFDQGLVSLFPEVSKDAGPADGHVV